MSTATRNGQFTELFKRFQALDPLSMLKAAAHNEYDGPNVAETSASLRFFFDTFEALFNVNGMQHLSFAAITNLQAHLQNFFFFQAEDGIRGADVTGVQTCALPI